MSINKVILITGASGFVGKALIKALANSEYELRGTVRSDSALKIMSTFAQQHQLTKVTFYNLGELSQETDWSSVMNGVDIIIHCAARAHVLQETSINPLAIFQEINTQGTIGMAQSAITYKAKRIIYLSSIGVLGNCNKPHPFDEYSTPNPQLPYAQSKLEAEDYLMRLTKQIEVVIIRPPLVYGPEVKGNFKKLLDLIGKDLPLPLGKIKNKRQFVGLANLVHFIIQCINAPAAANQSFLVADKEVVSTTQLIRMLSKLMGKKSLLIPIPHHFLKWGLHLIGKKKMAEQLLSNLEVNVDKAQKLLGWEPPYTLLEQLEETIIHYKQRT